MSASKPDDVSIKVGEKDPDYGKDEVVSVGKRRWCTKVVLINTAMLIAWVAVFEGVGFGFGQAFPQTNWYWNLTRSPGEPPPATFGIVWAILFAAVATFGWFLSLGLKEVQIVYLFILFWVQVILCYLWIPVFNALEQIIAGLCILSVLILLVGTLIVRMWMLELEILGVKTRYISLLIVPYWLWICYATHLNAYVVAMNPDKL